MRKVVLAGAAVVVLLAACGGDDDKPAGSGGTSAPAATTPAQTPTEATSEPAGDAPVQLEGKVDIHASADLPAGGEIELEVADSYFEPTFVKAKAGSKVTAKLHVEGELPHTFTIDDPKIDENLPTDVADKTVTFTMPDSGFVNFYCKIHRSLGMQGAFYVG